MKHAFGSAILLAVCAGVAFTGVACTGAAADSAEEGSAPLPVEEVEAMGEPEGTTGEPEGSWNQADWDIFASHIREAEDLRLASKPVGEAIAALARTFVGTIYTPGTLEAEGPEGLVINFREFDCVTFVETLLAMTRFIRESGSDPLWNRARAEANYEGYLADLRYRGGVIDGYPSRLHYFSEWFADNARMGLLTDVTSELSPLTDAEPIDYMSTHAEAYRQLSDSAFLEQIVEMEARLNGLGPRLYVPQDRISEIETGIESGDVIAATSTVAGLDIAHTGIAIRIDGRIYMIHAPLVGRVVELSDVPLADRIRSISTQDGVMVARWADR